MSPETAEVARALVALPDDVAAGSVERLRTASRWPWKEHRGPQGWARDGATSRCKDGMQWVWCGQWAPDLGDPATVGVLLAMLDESHEIARITDVRCDTREVAVVMKSGVYTGSCLGEAVAKALLAVWGGA